LVELKNGVTFNGHLVECDSFMNVTLREVYQTSADGERFWKMKEMFIKGNIVSDSRVAQLKYQIKYFRIADAILDQAAEEQEKQRAQIRSRGGARGEPKSSLNWIELICRWTRREQCARR
jgi:U6 snRNA-associated Sm-like protein LSm4